MFRVDPKTVTRWAESGRLSGVKTLGGHHRFWQSEVRQLLTPPCDTDVQSLRDLAVWLVSLDEPDSSAERRAITLTQIIDRARRALADTSVDEV